MSKPVKLKPNKKKGISPETKTTLSNVFRGIISNQSCVDGGKDSPWWIAVIFLVLSLILPLIPIMVNQSKAYGASVVNGGNFGADQGICNTFQKAKDDGWEFNIKGNLMTFNKEVSEEAKPIAVDYIVTDNKVFNFELYVTDKQGGELQEYINTISNTFYRVGTLNPYVPTPEGEEDPTNVPYRPSFLILNSYTMGMALYKSQTNSMATSSYGGLTWTNTPDGDLIDYVLVSGDKAKTFDNFKNVLNQTYIEQKNVNFRNNVLIYLGVYAGLIFILGLLIFILTRGKKNMFNFLSFFQTQRIAWWAAFTPALLGMIFAFIFSTNVIGQMSFVVFLSLRIMWLSMRQLRPAQ